MFRYLERSENISRMIEAGWRIALTRSEEADSEWESVVRSAGVHENYRVKYESIEASQAINFLLRDKDNPSSVLSAINAARSNARMVRTALSSEVWEATNECWMAANDILKRPVSDRNLADALAVIRHRGAVVRGALHGTMLRNDIFNFCRLGTFLERSDATSRILDVKYYVLLPSAASVGSTIDNTQWEIVLRSVSALRSFRWLNGPETRPSSIADFLILDRRMPRSLAFCINEIKNNLSFLEQDYGTRQSCQDLADSIFTRCTGRQVDTIFDEGLHEFLEAFLADTTRLSGQIEQDFRFYH